MSFKGKILQEMAIRLNIYDSERNGPRWLSGPGTINMHSTIIFRTVTLVFQSGTVLMAIYSY